ncbi:MAG: protein-L-isoaspartate O-methyltransferase [Parvularculaceae bacterium]
MDYEAARRMMIDSQVRPNDVTDPRIQQALANTPREAFLPAGLREQAYVEREIVYAPGRSLIVARDFAKLLAALAPRAGELALDVAFGAGYSTAVLAKLCGMAVGVEAEAGLAEEAQATWSAQSVDNAAAVVGDPAAGAPDEGPYDVILVAHAVGRIPEALTAQLRDGGRLGAIRRAGAVSKGVIVSRTGAATATREAFDAAAANVLPGFEAPRAFAF